MPRAIVHLVPDPMAAQQMMGQQLAQAFSAFGIQGPGGRIPVEVPPEHEKTVTVEGATHSQSDGMAVKLLDAQNRERALFPLHRIDRIEFEG
jgi:hypothetical protein